MAALVELEHAKDHLRPTGLDDQDVQRKIEHASAIILDFLKDRANIVATVSSSSVAAASVITTSAAHGFTTGDTTVIAGHAGSTPDLNGSHVVTVVDSLTFTVPVTVTVAGTGGTATVDWTPATVPLHVQAVVLKMLIHLYENRGDDMQAGEALWAEIGRVLARSRDMALA